MKHIIVGGVAGGATAAARIRRADEQAEIILFEKGNIPIVSTIPAIPGSVSTAPNETSTPNRKNKLHISATLATQPYTNQ